MKFFTCLLLIVFLPFEQFFPFPDGMVYLDVSPSDTLKRKKYDKHSISEMVSKRKNYLSLLKEFDEIKIIKSPFYFY